VSEQIAEYVLLIQDDGGDYYVGQSAALYLNGQRIWFGYSNDEAKPLLESVLGERLTVRLVKAKWISAAETCWWPTLDEQAAHNDGDVSAAGPS
jgi:hypothetical protein